MSPKPHRAIVIGASISGLLIGRALADFYDEVLLVDKEGLDEGVAPRKAVPQGNHIHGILTPTYTALQAFFPGLIEELKSHGAQVFDSGVGTRFHILGEQLVNGHTDQPLIGCTRPFFEHHLRRRVSLVNNVIIRTRQRFERWLPNNDNSRIIGVELTGAAGTDQLAADLVVDARGRASTLPKDLVSLGYDAPRQESTGVDLGYTSRLYEAPGFSPPWSLLLVNQSAPDVWVSAVIGKVENERWIATQVGYFGEHPPAHEAGFLAFAKGLQTQEYATFLEQAQPVTDFQRFGTRDCRMFRYEELDRFPGNLLVVGDAVCSLNPVYGQGMTKAAKEAMYLHGMLAEHQNTGTEFDGFAKRFRKGLPGVGADWAWDMTTGADLGFEQTIGRPRTRGDAMMGWYMKRLFQRAINNLHTRQSIFNATMLVKSPQSLLSPRMILHALGM